MALPARRTDFETRLLTALENIRADINGWVILPNHYHYVTDPYEWPWLSLQNYVDSHGRDWLREKWKEYHPGDFGAGWDD